MGLAKTILRRVRPALGKTLAGVLRGSAAVARRLPGRTALAFGDALALVLYLVNSRGRKAGHQNLRAVFGDGMPVRERRRILRGSYRTIFRAGWSLLHLQPLTPENFARWVTVTPELEASMRSIAAEVKTAVLVGGHFGNWELLLAMRMGLPYSPKFAYLVEATPVPELDRALDFLRARGSVSGALRKGGSLALKAALGRGDSVGILVDRNLRSEHGGVYVPFLGLPARTTPLPVLLARRFGVPLAVSMMIPEGRFRWRLWIGPNLMEPPTDDEDADVRKVLGKINDELSRAILQQPEAWLWMIKRWKSRPTLERGRYPEYSYYDPDPA